MGHTVHAVTLEEVLTVFAPQAAQPAPVPRLYQLGEVQAEQLVMPVEKVCKPLAQPVQLALPVEAATECSGQPTQLLMMLGARNVPTVHAVQAVLPSVAVVQPPAHEVQAVLALEAAKVNWGQAAHAP